MYLHFDYRKDSSTSSNGSVPNTPEAVEVRRLRQKQSKSAKKIDNEYSISIPKLPYLPERSTYPVDLKNGETLPPSKPFLPIFCQFDS